MDFRFSKIIFSCLLIIILFLPNFWGFGQDFRAEEFCPSFVEELDQECERLGVEPCREYLEKCEKYYQEKSTQYQSEISQLQQKKRTLENQIYWLESRIKNLSYQIHKNNLIIKDLNFQIKDTQSSIEKTSLKIEEIKENLANILQLRYEEDQRSLVEIFLREETLADFFDNLMALEALNLKTQEILKDIKNLKSSLENQRDKMLGEKEELERTLILVKLQKEENQNLRSQKKELLEKTRGEEALYQKYLEETKKKAQEIRKKIFELAQVPIERALTLEEAYRLAVEVERITGVRAALLLGLLKVESDIGKNVGQCNCRGSAFCRHPEISWKEVMTKKHWPYFEKITAELGLDPSTTPVSCAVDEGKVQWGGAMGPAQFMPETWLKLGYKQRVEEITGQVPANPWRVRDAFLAAGLYLADWGAGSKREIDEIGAVTAYLCGTSRMTRRCRIAGGRWYLYQVMKYASQFQNYINQGVFEQ